MTTGPVGGAVTSGKGSWSMIARACGWCGRLALALMLALIRPVPAHAHSQGLVVSVSRHGFERMVNYEVEVEAGHPVTLAFTYADDDLEQDNPHEIRVQGPGLSLPNVLVSRSQPTASLTFTPTATGTLRIICIVPCLGMENLIGALRVTRPRATGRGTQLTLELTAKEEGAVLAQVQLTDASGSPLADQPVELLRRTSVGGELVMARPSTMDDGTAAALFYALEPGSVEVLAYYPGGGGYASAEVQQAIEAAGVHMDHLPSGLAAPAPPPAFALILILVVGGVWSAYAFVVVQLVRIARGPQKESQP